jgi:hypothetical protein
MGPGGEGCAKESREEAEAQFQVALGRRGRLTDQGPHHVTERNKMINRELCAEPRLLYKVHLTQTCSVQRCL